MTLGCDTRHSFDIIQNAVPSSGALDSACGAACDSRGFDHGGTSLRCRFNIYQPLAPWTNQLQKLCIANTTITTGLCDVTDSICICTNAALNVEIEACVVAACTIKEALRKRPTTASDMGYPLTRRTQRRKSLAMSHAASRAKTGQHLSGSLGLCLVQLGFSPLPCVF